MSTEKPDEGAARMVQFLARKALPCTVVWEENGERCGGAVGPYFAGNPTDGIRAVYTCFGCGATWDHEGQPLWGPS